MTREKAVLLHIFSQNISECDREESHVEVRIGVSNLVVIVAGAAADAEALRFFFLGSLDVEGLDFGGLEFGDQDFGGLNFRGLGSREGESGNGNDLVAHASRNVVAPRKQTGRELVANRGGSGGSGSSVNQLDQRCEGAAGL